MTDREKVIETLESCVAKPLHTKGDKFVISFDVRFVNAIIELLKEQEAVKPVRDKETGRIWLCGNCGSYVGFEDHDEDDPNEFNKFCSECGRPVLWEGR